MKKSIFALNLLSGLFFTACDTAKSSVVTTTTPSATTAESSNPNNNKTARPDKAAAKNGQNTAPVHAPASNAERAPGKN